MLHPQAVEVLLKLAEFANVRLHLGESVVIFDLVDHQLRFASDQESFDSETHGGSQTGEQPFIFCYVVRGGLSLE